MRLRVELSVDDLVAFSLHHHQSSPTLKRSRVWAVIAIVVLTATLSHIAGELLRNPLLRPLGIAAAIFLALVYPRIWRRKLEQYVRLLYREGQNRGVLGTHSFEIVDNGLLDVTSYYERTVFWNGIERIETVPGRTFVYLSAVNAQVIPEDSVKEGNYSAFIDELHKQWLKHNDQQAPQS